mmetsp:Transcript_57094/g.66713  ORF Transcript_57094/g.66713 Transcript_57094/m.66713 type:complete len:293 (+) Transcript_57094:49-927(+)|eukprot:CAMPEP_0194377822 /NCGR_PEP_ID=MMETSP0174-20130528/32531_1 /TAXON_ID=216777 /ORGANISM="Proboscia alata, Strain PI-D3" /LENGTH=292 /DNA_ID=CAMNT_0039159431 /DNA_START=56 /DNA_END=934 /DNA_ORIENTATION=-
MKMTSAEEKDSSTPVKNKMGTKKARVCPSSSPRTLHSNKVKTVSTKYAREQTDERRYSERKTCVKKVSIKIGADCEQYSDEENYSETDEEESIASNESDQTWALRDHVKARILKQVMKLNAEFDDEEIVSECKIKLFVFTSGKDSNSCQWVSQGCGNMKFLRHTEEGITYGTIRVVMTQAGTGRTICNFYAEPSIAIKQSTDKGGQIRFTWATLDYANNCRGGTRMFAVRFKKDEEAKAMAWKENFEDCIKKTFSARCGFDCADTSAADVLIDTLKSLETEEDSSAKSKRCR